MQFWFVYVKVVNINFFFQVGEKGSLNSAFKAQSVSVTNMLEKLVMEKELKFVAFAEEVQYKAVAKWLEHYFQYNILQQC